MTYFGMLQRFYAYMKTTENNNHICEYIQFIQNMQNLEDITYVF